MSFLARTLGVPTHIGNAYGVGANAYGPAQNSAVLIPAPLYVQMVVSQMLTQVSTGGGTWDAGIYDASFRRIARTGSTAGGGPLIEGNVILVPALYWLAIVNGNGIGQLSGVSIVPGKVTRVDAAAGFPLPTTLNPVETDVGIPILCAAP